MVFKIHQLLAFALLFYFWFTVYLICSFLISFPYLFNMTTACRTTTLDQEMHSIPVLEVTAA